jgi:hypothetical protein
VAGALLDSVELDQGVRLLGVSLAGLGDPDTGFQLSFDLGPAAADPATEGSARAYDEAERIQQSRGAVTAAVDAIRARYGGSSVGPASLVGAQGLRVRHRGDAQWGPSARSEPELGDGRPSAL